MPEIRNPNLQTPGTPGGSGSGGDMRSTMAFFILMLAVLFGYQYFFKPKPAQTTPPAQTQSLDRSQSSSPQTGAPGSAQSSGSSTQSIDAGPTVIASSETETTVENELYKIVFTNRGAQVKSWILKKYQDLSGKPLDMVQPQTAARFGFPLSFFTYEPSLTSQLNQVLYQPSATGLLLAPNSLSFHYAAYGLDVVKTFHFDSSYVLSVETQVKRNGAPVRALVQWPAGLGDMEEFAPNGKAVVRTVSQFAWSIDGRTDQQASAKVSGNATINQPYQYAGITDLYFAAAVMPDSLASASLVTIHNTVDLPGDLTDPNSQKKPADVIGFAMGDQSGYSRLRLYAGPKQMDVLSTIHSIGADGKADGPSLEPLIHYGWLGIVAKPLYIALRFFHGLLGAGINTWGWSIIIFTAAFNLIMLPTRFIMMKSSVKMMRIQPKVDAIRKKYAHLKMNDPKRAEMNTEIMALHQAEGINMLGGCLPLIVQMPLFIAYFEVLSNVIELRQAHWFWLTDLSQPDPLHILPILIILSMFLTQYITPSPGMDPAQRRMMAFMMPIFFGFMLWHYASGLALYWGTSNLINLALQLGINQSPMGKEMHAIAAKRAAKKPGNSGGSQRTIQGRR
ncbi:MAG: membrane protein insertase YidC [Terracidiphilus sp.]